MVLLPGRYGPVDDEAVAARAQRVPAAHLLWRGGPGAPPRARPVLPLLDRSGAGSPGLVLALTYAEARDAAALEQAGGAALVLDPPPSGPAGSEEDQDSWVISCDVTVVPDPEGDAFGEDLLLQELRRRPGSRLLADSPLLRREHPWFLPRLVVHLRPVGLVPLPVTAGADHLLAVDGPDHLHVLGVAVPDGTPRARGQRVEPPLPDGASVDAGPAALAGYALSPDRERSASWSWVGRWDGSALVVDQGPDDVGPPRVPGVLARWRSHRAFEQACRRGLREAGLPG